MASHVLMGAYAARRPKESPRAPREGQTLDDSPEDFFF